MSKRIQAGEVRLSLPTPENVRPIKAVAYDEFAAETFGEFAVLNFPEVS